MKPREFTQRYFELSRAIVATILIGSLVGCTGQSYNCGPGAPPCNTSSDQHCYGVVSWTGSFTGFSTELTAVALTSGDGFVDDEAWLVDQPASEVGMAWVEAGEINEGIDTLNNTDYFWAYGLDWCQPDEQFMWYDLGAVAKADINKATWIAYEFRQDDTTPTKWNITISYADSGKVLFKEHATGISMKPNTAEEGQELQGTTGAEAKLAFFSQNTTYNGSSKKVRTDNGTVLSGNPPHAGWWTDSKPSQTNFGGLFFTWCC
jgi:hypothetical protein